MSSVETKVERIANVAANVACVIISFLLIFPLIARFV